MAKFQNKNVLITGAASGIGRATALEFANEGANLVLVDRDEDKLHETQSLLPQGTHAVLLHIDITASDAPTKMIETVKNHFGQLHVAFNNCGVVGPNVDITEYSDEDWNRVMEVNVNAVFRSMKTQIVAMREYGQGAIVNTTSVASHNALAQMSAYIASKHALLGLTKAAALDAIKDGIRINSVSPGIIATPLLAHGMQIPGMIEAMEASQPIGRMGQAEEIAKCVVFLASEDASLMVGASMIVDGGVTVV